MTEQSDDCDVDLENMATSSTVSDYFQNGQQLNVIDFNDDKIIANGSDPEESNNFFFSISMKFLMTIGKKRMGARNWDL